jgi:hypothetical protein
MKAKIITIALCLSLISLITNAQYKKDGTPDMRYNTNKSNFGNSNLNNFNTQTETRFQSGYLKDNGTYVQPTLKTNPNSTNLDNFSTQGNYNPYSGTNGTKAKDYSLESFNYGSGQTIQTGPKGGQYYINNNGSKVYVPKQ